MVFFRLNKFMLKTVELKNIKSNYLMPVRKQTKLQASGWCSISRYCMSNRRSSFEARRAMGKDRRSYLRPDGIYLDKFFDEAVRERSRLRLEELRKLWASFATILLLRTSTTSRKSWALGFDRGSDAVHRRASPEILNIPEVQVWRAVLKLAVLTRAQGQGVAAPHCVGVAHLIRTASVRRIDLRACRH